VTGRKKEIYQYIPFFYGALQFYFTVSVKLAYFSSSKLQVRPVPVCLPQKNPGVYESLKHCSLTVVVRWRRLQQTAEQLQTADSTSHNRPVKIESFTSKKGKV